MLDPCESWWSAARAISARASWSARWPPVTSVASASRRTGGRPADRCRPDPGAGRRRRGRPVRDEPDSCRGGRVGGHPPDPSPPLDAGSGSPAHVVYISIVGCDVPGYPYYGVKHRTEQVLEAWGGPTIGGARHAVPCAGRVLRRLPGRPARRAGRRWPSNRSTSSSSPSALPRSRAALRHRGSHARPTSPDPTSWVRRRSLRWWPRTMVVGRRTWCGSHRWARPCVPSPIAATCADQGRRTSAARASSIGSPASPGHCPAGCTTPGDGVLRPSPPRHTPWAGAGYGAVSAATTAPTAP